MATHSDSATVAAPAFSTPMPIVPPLESGDRLSREEFNRRWEANPQINHAELIFGVVYVHAPISLLHGDFHARIITWLSLYADATPGTNCGSNASVVLGENSQPEPDGHLRITAKHRGQPNKAAKNFLDGAPDLIVEIAASSASYDLHDKRELYRLHGVREYLVWRVHDNALDWFVLRNGVYEQITPGIDGILRSECFPGLWLDWPAIQSGKLGGVVQQLQLGLATAEHADFVLRLNQTAQ